MKRTVILLLLSGTALDVCAQGFWQRCLPTYAGTVYSLASDANGDVFAGTADGLYHSSDNGDTWTLLGGLPDTTVRFVTVAGNGDIYAVAATGLHRSRGGAAALERLDLPEVAGTIGAVAVTPTGTIIAGSRGDRIYRSIDDGATWEAHGPARVKVTTFLVDPKGFILAGLIVGGEEWGILRSTDDGITWSIARKGLSYANVNALLADDAGSIFAATYNHVPTAANVRRSSDEGITWVEQGLMNTWVTSLAIDSRGTIFAGTMGRGFSDLPTWHGVVRRMEGDQWSTISLGLTNYDVWSLTINADNIAFAGTGEGLFRSVRPTSGVEDDAVSDATLIRSITPNPIVSEARIGFSLAATCNVRVDVHDALGRLVAVLEPGSLPAGNHDVVWKTGDIESGLYLCRVRSGNSAITRTLMVVR